jgi:hypothetical protein
MAVLILALAYQLYAKAIPLARRSVPCSLVGSSCDELPDANGAFCCDPSEFEDLSQTFVQCDPLTNTIFKATCLGSTSCLDDSNGEALCQ